MKAFLIKGQENALSLTARAISTVLHDRPELFAKKISDEANNTSTSDVYVVPLANYIKIDGDQSDWGEQLNQLIKLSPQDAVIPTDFVGPQQEFKTNKEHKVAHLLAYRGSYLYALFIVEDNQLIYRGKDFLRTDLSDHLRLTIQTPTNFISRYAITARQSGVMTAYRVDKNWVYPIDGKPINDLLANIKPNNTGYVLEMRIPRYLVSQESRMQLSIIDVDRDLNNNLDSGLGSDKNDNEYQANNGISANRSSAKQFRFINSYSTTPDSPHNDQFSRLLLQTPEIDKILKGLNRSDTRIWVLDKEKRVRTVVGNLSSEKHTQTTEKPTQILLLAKYYYKKLLSYIFNIILKQPNSEFNDFSADTLARDEQVLDFALAGSSVTDRRSSLNQGAEIIMTANPIWSGNQVIGAVVVEQSSGEVLSQQREALENVISVTLITLVVVLSTILFFASRLTLRIRRLRNAAENAIDKHGKIIEPELRSDARSGDEVGDLSRSISNMLSRLSQYTNYLKGLPDTLSHEVSNPLNVVNSSLHNLRSEHPLVSDSIYLKRAEKGLHRIRKILTNLTEAANLEQAMEAEEFTHFNLMDLVSSYVEGYQSANSEQNFIFQSLAKHLIIRGAPDHIAQMLDKLVDNAMDFNTDDHPILVRLRKDDTNALIDVINEGSSLPDKMQERIFEPMVSLGRKDAQKTRLGMGLYVVKLITSFHGGDVSARNLRSRKGVIFTVSLPIASEFIDSPRIAPRL